MLPELEYSAAGDTKDGIFFKTNEELRRVLVQGNPVYLALDLPGMLTQVIVCFPAPRAIRIYGKRIRHGATFFLGEVIDGYTKRSLPQDVQYRYGMRFVPWMFIRALPPHVSPEKDHLVNYIVTNSDVGYSGVLLRVFRSFHGERKESEWLEIRHFNTGNEYLFFREENWREEGQLLTRLIPERIDGTLEWKPEQGWNAYPQRSFEASTRY